jgi:hypothetical protein
LDAQGRLPPLPGLIPFRKSLPGLKDYGTAVNAKKYLAVMSLGMKDTFELMKLELGQ